MPKPIARIALLLVLAAMPGFVQADSPLMSLMPYKRTASDSGKSYDLTEENGPWMILAANFDGVNAEKEAQDLVIELRSRFRMPAFIHRQVYDYSKPVEALNPNGEKARMKYVNQEKYLGVAVLVGDFRSVNEPELERMRDQIKTIQPECLAQGKSASSSNRFAGLSGLKRRVTGAKKRGPMASAFVTRNPLLPEEPASTRGIDSFVARLNKGVDHSLLDNPGRYTVRVATFQGSSTINQREIETIEARDQVSDKLQVAADRAHRLTAALRKQGVEAYEFHDRLQSVVTVGSFASEKQTPEMFKIVERYRATQKPAPNKTGVAVQPRMLVGIPFDVEPLPMEVPRRSFAADYAR